MKLPELRIGNLVAKVPIIQGGMAIRLSTARLAAAVANEGGIGLIAASGLRMLVERKVDYTNPVNMILTSVILVVGLSGAELAVGPVVLKGMGLATVVGMAMSIILLILQKTGVGNDQLKKTEVYYHSSLTSWSRILRL